MSKLLTETETEIKTVTGYDQAAKQCQSLQEHGVFFIKDRYGCPHTTWYNLNHPIPLRPSIFIDRGEKS